MFQVETHGPGYKVSIGDGHRGGYKARDLGEVKVALEHYFQRPPHFGQNGDCPLCRAMG